MASEGWRPRADEPPYGVEVEVAYLASGVRTLASRQVGIVEVPDPATGYLYPRCAPVWHFANGQQLPDPDLWREVPV